jgi:cytoskeletal protein RodZ
VFEIGSSLRDARIRQGLELNELEADTKIRAKYLKALEEEHFELLPGDAYVKGFLRTYAERLGLDGQLYVDEFNSRFSFSEEPVHSSHPRRRTRRSRLESHAVLLALAGIVAVTVLVIAAWQIGSSDEGQSAEPQPPAPAASPPAQPPAVSTAEPAVDPPAQQPSPRASLLVTAAAGPSAVEARRGSATGELLFEGTIAKGQSQLLEARRLWLRIARPQNVALELNGEGVHLVTDGAGPVVVTVTSAGVQPVDAP